MIECDWKQQIADDRTLHCIPSTAVDDENDENWKTTNGFRIMNATRNATKKNEKRAHGSGHETPIIL